MKPYQEWPGICREAFRYSVILFAVTCGTVATAAYGLAILCMTTWFDVGAFNGMEKFTIGFEGFALFWLTTTTISGRTLALPKSVTA